jgi:hypothetical protein
MEAKGLVSAKSSSAPGHCALSSRIAVSASMIRSRDARREPDAMADALIALVGAITNQ